MTHKCYKLVIPGVLPSLNEYIRAERGNRYHAASLKKQTEDMIAACIAQQLRGVRFDGPVKITYTWYEENRKRDKDNIAFAKKFIQDALVATGVLENDGWQEIVSFSDEFRVDKSNPRVEVVIESIEKGGE